MLQEFGHILAGFWTQTSLGQVLQYFGQISVGFWAPEIQILDFWCPKSNRNLAKILQNLAQTSLGPEPGRSPAKILQHLAQTSLGLKSGRNLRKILQNWLILVWVQNLAKIQPKIRPKILQNRPD